MTDKNEVLELAKKCGAELAKTFDGEDIAQFTGAQLLAFDAAREEKHRAQIARMVDRFMKIIAEPQETLSDAKAMREMLRIAKAALSEHQQSTEAFLAAVRAKAKLEGKIEAMEEAAIKFERKFYKDTQEAEYKEDAMRYRWLRNFLAVEDIERIPGDFKGHVPDEAESVKTDAAIDSIRARGEK